MVFSGAIAPTLSALGVSPIRSAPPLAVLGGAGLNVKLPSEAIIS